MGRGQGGVDRQGGCGLDRFRYWHNPRCGRPIRHRRSGRWFAVVLVGVLVACGNVPEKSAAIWDRVRMVRLDVFSCTTDANVRASSSASKSVGPLPRDSIDIDYASTRSDAGWPQGVVDRGRVGNTWRHVCTLCAGSHVLCVLSMQGQLARQSRARSDWELLVSESAKTV
jgi:hypothetical protein